MPVSKKATAGSYRTREKETGKMSNRRPSAEKRSGLTAFTNSNVDRGWREKTLIGRRREGVRKARCAKNAKTVDSLQSPEEKKTVNHVKGVTAGIRRGREQRRSGLLLKGENGRGEKA